MTASPMDAAFAHASQVNAYIQGEVLEVPDACVVLADARRPLDESSRQIVEQTGADGLVVVPDPVDRVVLLTQTCDLQQTDPASRFCQVAPVVDREEAFAHAVARGRHPGWVALPWYSPSAVGDLSRITTVERSVVAAVPTSGRPATPAEQLHFAEAVSRHFTRAALPDPVTDVLRPFLQRMKDKHDKQSPEGQCMGLVANLRVEADPGLDDDYPSLTLLVVLEAGDLPALPAGPVPDDDRIDALINRGAAESAKEALGNADPVRQREAWVALAELWLAGSVDLAATLPGVDSIDVEVLSGDELSFTRVRNAPELDLAYLSTRAA